jgi:acetyltransferase-like isoleucine patch superfamily enzyme
MKKFIALFSMALPWPLRRAFLRYFFGYEISDTSRIGLSWIYPKKLVMKAGARIGHLTICKDIDLLEMAESTVIGNLDWITGYPSGPCDRGHFAHQVNRRPELILGPHAAITNRHFIDCTEYVHVGAYASVAGFASQLMTHSIDIEKGRQDSHPITVGAYCFVGTNCVLLGGSALPDYSVLGAKSLLNKALTEKYYLYGGVPAKALKALPHDSGYFTRQSGYVI